MANTRSTYSYVAQRSLGNVPSSSFPADVSSLYNVYDGTPNQKDILGHFGCVNAVEMNNTESLIASGGDDRRVLIWYTSDLMTKEHPKPFAIMDELHLSNVFALEFSRNDRLVMSGGNDGYLLAHDIETGKLLGRYDGNAEAVYNICCNPLDDHTVAATRENGTVTLYDIREDNRASQAVALKISLPGAKFYSGRYNPCFSPLFAVATNGDLRNGVLLYDLRCIERGDLMDSKLEDGECFPNGAIFARWNSTGTALGVLRSQGSPLYVDLLNKRLVACNDPKYENVHTIKSVEFIDDSALVVGSDNFDLYVWKIPDMEPRDEDNPSDSSPLSLFPAPRLGGHKRRAMRRTDIWGTDKSIYKQTLSEATAVLKGHRSIVNHVRYSPRNKMIVSCGVEKIVKCWTALKLPRSYDIPRTRTIGGSLFRRNRERTDGDSSRGHPNTTSSDSDASMELDSDVEGRDGEEGDENTGEDLGMLNYFDGVILRRRRHRRRFIIMDRRNGNADITNERNARMDMLIAFRRAGSDSSTSSFASLPDRTDIISPSSSSSSSPEERDSHYPDRDIPWSISFARIADRLPRVREEGEGEGTSNSDQEGSLIPIVNRRASGEPPQPDDESTARVDPLPPSSSSASSPTGQPEPINTWPPPTP